MTDMEEIDFIESFIGPMEEPTQAMWNECAAIKLRLYWLRQKISADFSEVVNHLSEKRRAHITNWQEKAVMPNVAKNKVLFSFYLELLKVREKSLLLIQKSLRENTGSR